MPLVFGCLFGPGGNFLFALVPYKLLGLPVTADPERAATLVRDAGCRPRLQTAAPPRPLHLAAASALAAAGWLKLKSPSFPLCQRGMDKDAGPLIPPLRKGDPGGLRPGRWETDHRVV